LEQTKRYFGNAARADGNGMTVIQQEQMEMYFENAAIADGWYFRTAARPYADGNLEL
jgi:hypothetical protein